jgi:hypothetical protein
MVSRTKSPGRAFEMRRGICVKSDVASFNREHAALRHGVPRIDPEIEDRIVNIAQRSPSGSGEHFQSDSYLIAKRSP